MKELFSKILHINNKYYSWILFFFSLVFILFPALCIVYIKDTGIGTWALNKTPTFTFNVLTSMFAISLIFVSVLFFLILIFRMKINKTRLLLLASISISLVLFSFSFLYTSANIPFPQNIGVVKVIGFLEYLQIYYLTPSVPGFSWSHIKADSVIKIFMIALSVYISNFLVIKNVFKINNFLNKKDLSSMNFIMLLLGLTAMTIFFYEVLSAREYSQYSPLDPYKFPTYIIQLTPFVLIQLYWSRKIRNSEFISAILSVIMIPAIFLSLYFDVISLFHRDFLPSSWTMFFPFTYLDMVIFFGTVFFPLTSFILLILLYKQIRSIIEIHYKNKKNISESRRSFMISIFGKFKK